MKTTYLCYAFLASALLCSTSLFAQDKPERTPKKLTPEERIERQAERMEKQLLLDDETSAKFLPLYKEYLKAMGECFARPADSKQVTKKEMTDEELDQRMQSRFECRKKCLEVQETYYDKFKEILTMRQVEKIFNAPKHQNRKPRVLTPRYPKGAPLPPEKMIR